MTTRPDPVLLAIAADQARLAAETLASAVTAAVKAGLVVDGEIHAAEATIASWASWLAGRAKQEGT